MRNTSLFLFVFALIFSVQLCAQNVGINASGTPPHPSAMLDVAATDKGLLIPRLTTSQRNALVNPATSLMIYNVTTDCLEMYFGTGLWKSVQCGCFAAPANPVQVTAPQRVCPGALNVAISTPTIPDAATYTWTVPSQDTLVSGQGTNAIVVSFANQSGPRNISVVATNSCGSSQLFTYTLDVSNLNPSFSPLAGNLNSPLAFTIANYPNTTYAWTFAQGTPANSSAVNPSVTWSTPGTYAVNVTLTDAFGCSAMLQQNVVISSCNPFVYSFTTCGKTGKDGPLQADCNSAYSSTNLQGNVTVSTQGIQQWSVPLTGNYRITVAGARGGPSAARVGGSGAVLSAVVSLTAGDVLKIVVGQEGGLNYNGNGGGGGGGSFVTYSNNTPIMVAGGGGGASQYGSSFFDGLPGSTLTAGSAANAGSGGNGGTIGSSGTGGGPGGGFNTDGGSNSYGTGGRAFLNGAAGAVGYSTPTMGFGGFGGAGGAGFSAGGGAGGYSGGGPGPNAAPSAAGGGGSFILTSGAQVQSSNGQYNGSSNFNGSIQNTGLWNNGAGYVTITRICP
jgi:hypothetical protein